MRQWGTEGKKLFERLGDYWRKLFWKNGGLLEEAFLEKWGIIGGNFFGKKISSKPPSKNFHCIIFLTTEGLLCEYRTLFSALLFSAVGLTLHTDF